MINNFYPLNVILLVAVFLFIANGVFMSIYGFGISTDVIISSVIAVVGFYVSSFLTKKTIKSDAEIAKSSDLIEQKKELLSMITLKDIEIEKANARIREIEKIALSNRLDFLTEVYLDETAKIGSELAEFCSLIDAFLYGKGCYQPDPLRVSQLGYSIGHIAGVNSSNLRLNPQQESMYCNHRNFILYCLPQIAHAYLIGDVDMCKDYYIKHMEFGPKKGVFEQFGMSATKFISMRKEYVSTSKPDSVFR